MCLVCVYEGKEKKDALAELPKSGYYWKTVKARENGYFPILFGLPNLEPFKVGWNRTKGKYIGQGYKVAFHLLRSKEAALGWDGKTVRCVIKKKDIVAIGTQGGDLTIVTERFWIPKPLSSITAII